MSLAGFKPTVPASEQPHTQALDCAATVITAQQLQQLKKLQKV